MNKNLKRLSLASFALILTLQTGCSVGPSRSEDGSTVRDIPGFDPANFNGGITFEQLVNPAYTRDGEMNAEAIDPSHRAWLAAIDQFGNTRESRNYVSYQQSMTPAQILAHNAELAALLERDEASTVGFSQDEANEMMKKLVGLPQVAQHAQYDPTFSIGFCFGRAMIVHSFARNAFVRESGLIKSLKATPVRKIWVSGPMAQWKHHLATMVMAREPGVGFWAIDNYVGRVVSANDWMKSLAADFPAANVMFNVSRANRFSEANSLRYYEVLLDDPFFNGFFRDFLAVNVPAINAAGGVDVTPTSPVAPHAGATPHNDEALGGAIPARLHAPQPVSAESVQ